MTVTRPAPDVLPAQPPAPARRDLLVRVARWLPLAAVLTVTAGVLWRLGTSPWDIARYAAYCVWAVLLPGVLVYRALRRTPHSLVDDLAMGAALGLVLEIGAFVTFSATGLRGLLWLWPLLVVVPFAVLRPLRRCWWVSGYRPAPMLWSWSVAGVAIFLLGYLTYAFLRPNQPLPSGGSRLYFIDQLHLLSLVGELKHHFPPETPQLAGEPLAYHWFAFAHMATASLISGVDTPVVFFRLALPAMCLLVVVLLAVVGWRVSGRPWVGALAAALAYAVGELVVGSLAVTPLGAATAYSVWSSESVPYGWLMTIPMIALALDRLAGGLPDAPVGAGAWPMLALFAVGASAGKASALPVTVAAAGLVALVEIVRRRPRRVTWLVIGTLLAAQLFAMAALFRFESLGMRIRPFAIIYAFVGTPDVSSWWKNGGLHVVLLTGFALYMLTRLAGIPVLARIKGRAWGTTEWFLLGGITGGVVGTLVLSHPAWGQNYFLRSGWAFGAILSAMGLIALAERHRVPGRVLAAIAVAVAAVACGLSAVLWFNGGGNGGPGYRAMLPIFRLALVTLAVGVIATLVLAGARRRWPRLRGVAAVSALALALGAGLPSMAWDARLYPNLIGWYHIPVDRDQADAARWLRANTDPDDVIATNVHCNYPPPQPCSYVSFWPSAYSERRYLLEGWGYAAEAQSIAGNTFTTPPQVPFWDPELLAMNEAAFYAPTTDVLDAIRARGVRWLIVDRRFGRESDALRTLTTPVWERGPVAIYRLNPA
jgi:hypothetical protein